VIVAAVAQETATARVQAWLATNASEDLLISDWVVSEVSSALSFKVRNGALDLPQRATALAAFHRLASESLIVVPVSRAHFRAAAHFADRHNLNLRAPDALHLAIAADRGAALITLDRRLHDAALQLGVAVEGV
jgi:predicted nucleic acid-binding protein